MKTAENEGNVSNFLNSIEPSSKKEDCIVIHELMQKLSGEPAKMWGKTIIGYGHYSYLYANGKPGTFFTIGFSPRKQNITLYVMSGIAKYPELLEKLGKHKVGKSCLYIKKITDIDMDVLEQIIQTNLNYFKSQNT